MTHMPHVMSGWTLRQQLDLSWKCAGVMERVCVTGGPWHWGSQPYCYFEEAKRGGLLRSVHRQMPMDLTGWPTSDPSRLLNDQIWYLTLWEWPGVTAAIPDIPVKSSCLSFLLLFPVIIFREWENHRNAKGKGQVVLAGFRKSLSTRHLVP